MFSTTQNGNNYSTKVWVGFGKSEIIEVEVKYNPNAETYFTEVKMKYEKSYRLR